jgi:hypothetical protein
MSHTVFKHLLEGAFTALDKFFMVFVDTSFAVVSCSLHDRVRTLKDNMFLGLQCVA